MPFSALRDLSSSNAASPLGIAQLLHALDSEFSVRSTCTIERFRFELDGMQCDARNINQKDRTRFLITARLGFQPFSIESLERRTAVQSIVAATKTLPNVRFAIDSEGKISAGSIIDALHNESPECIFYPLKR